ncbi:MAG: hypothetical protein ACREDR_16510 [Blastocatellia bacterium]
MAIFETAQKDASVARFSPEASFGWICGQFSIGRSWKEQEEKKIPGDKASEKNEEKTVLGR